MPAFEPIGDITRARINELAACAVERFRSAIRPIYGSSANGSAEHIGTCLALSIADKRYLLTAAHVIDWNATTSLYVGNTELTLLSMDFLATMKPVGNRLHDHYDFAIGELSKDDIQSLDQVQYLKTEGISSSAIDSVGTVYTSIGYPNSKNKKADSAQKSVPTQIFNYSNTATEHDALKKKLQISGSDHIFIGFNPKYSKDMEGKRINSIRLNGVSGGAVVNLGNLAKPEILAGTQTPAPKLAGLFIEFHKAEKIILATRIQTILAAINTSE